jgi:signal transduction histidine kinase
MGFLVEPLEAMEGAASGIVGALDEVLAEGGLTHTGAVVERLQRVQDGRRELVDGAEAVRRGVQANPGCSLTAVLDDAVGMRTELLAARGVTLRSVVDVRREGDAVRGSRYVLFTVFENLLANAVRAMEERSEKNLVLSASSDGAACRITVTDTGIGMAGEQLKSLFVDRGEHAEGGFGLPYSRRILERLGGGISVTSEPERGSTFEVIIPHWSPEVGAEIDGQDDEATQETSPGR